MVFPMQKNELKILVLRLNPSDKCIGTGSLFIEQNEDRKIGHIEDFVIDEHFHGSP